MNETKDGGVSPAAGSVISRSFWLSMTTALVVMAAAAVFLFIQSRDSFQSNNISASPAGSGSVYEDQLNEQWNAIQTVSAELIKKEQSVIDQATLDDFSASVRVASKRIDGALEGIESIPSVPEEFRNRQLELKAAINSLQDYLGKLQGLVSRQAADVNQDEFEPLDSAGSDAKKKTDLAADEMVFLERLPGALFTLQTDLLILYQSIWEKGVAPVPGQGTSQNPQSRSGQPSPVPSPQTGAPSATETITRFGSSYVAHDINGMSRLIYEPEAASDFSTQSSDAYPYSFEILEGPTMQGGNYIYRLMFLFEGANNPFLEDWTIIVTEIGPAFYITGVNLELRSEFTDN